MKILKEFRDFIQRGRVIDLAIAVVMGGAFNAIITSLVKDLLMPLLSILTMGTDFTKLAIQIGDGPYAAQLTYGNFIAAVINFLLIALSIFLAIKLVNRFATNKIAQPPEAPPTKTCPYCGSDIPEVALRCPHCTTVLDEAAVPPALR
ncbi:MAG: large conductance mechanosensitive channel protein MscL [Actinomycetia bacterium]|nr:large conductance mechanosensitive channel protein MscL [Actinomycetes bacterium]